MTLNSTSLSPFAEQAMQFETVYLAGVQANLDAATGRLISGTVFRREDHDQAEVLRTAMAHRRLYDRGMFAALPHGRGITIRGFERKMFLGERLRSVTVATVLIPPEQLLDGDGAVAPISLTRLVEHVRRFVTYTKVPRLIGVCAPGGFADDAWNAASLALPDNVKVVLAAPRADGGWRVRSVDERLDVRLVRIFDPEKIEHKVERIRRELDRCRTDLLTGGLSARNLAQRLELSLRLVQTVFEQCIREDPQLRMTQESGDALLYVGASSLTVPEDRPMTWSDRFKNIFASEGDESRKVNALAERRAALSRRLDRLYDDIGRLERREQQMLDEGRAASSALARKRLAGQIARLRKDIERFHATASMISKQINVISTHIHNLELAQAGQSARLPSSEALTEAAVEAEEMMEQLNATHELAESLEVSVAEAAATDEESQILTEFDQPALATARSADSEELVIPEIIDDNETVDAVDEHESEDIFDEPDRERPRGQAQAE